MCFDTAFSDMRNGSATSFGRDAATLQSAANRIGADTVAVQGDVRRIDDLNRASDDSVYCVATELMLDGGLSQLAYQP